MFLSRTSLPRRTFLRGLGTTLALPMLDAMVPALTASAKTASRLRFGAVYVPNGVIMEQWAPAKTSGDFEFTPILKSLEQHRQSVVAVTNLSRPGKADSHAVAGAGWLSGTTPKRTEAEDFRLNPTIDQVLAQHIGQDTPFPSIEMATEDFAGYVGGCDPGYACAYMNTLSWTNATTPLPMEINPRVLFERMFGRPGTRAQRLTHMREDHSILDSIIGEVRTLTDGLGTPDRARLDQYLQNVREIERRIQRTEAHNQTEVGTAIDAPLGVPESYAEHAELMFDLLAVAYESELTRIGTFMMAREASFKTYPEIGITEPHHAMSHHGGNPERIANHAKLNAYHVSLFARFIDRLAATPDGDGTLLDHALIVYGAGMSDGNKHSAAPLPLVMLGGGAGRGNRYVELAPHTPIGNLWVTVAGTFGCPVESVGESTGRVEL